MKQFIAAMALVATVAGPNAAFATVTTVSTGLDQDGGAPQASAPIVAAKWEMNGPTASLLGTDEQTTAGSQIMPSGQCGVNKTVSICGVVTDPNGKLDIKSVYGDVYYPTTVKLGASHVDPVTGQKREVATCGEMVRECKMTALSATNAFNLFCNNIRNNNANLPTFAANYSYANICDTANEGILAKETGYVYCCDFTMSYEDPNGDYKVNVWANDQSDYNSTILSNSMRYLATKAYDVDFTGINYGKVKTGVWQEVPGNTVWATTPTLNGATVRNCSSTRLTMGVWQDSMGIKDPDGTDYVSYKAAVSSSANYKEYENDLLNEDGTHKFTWLKADLDLSEMNEMDFGVLVSKFPIQLQGPFTGTIELNAKAADHTVCNPT